METAEDTRKSRPLFVFFFIKYGLHVSSEMPFISSSCVWSSIQRKTSVVRLLIPSRSPHGLQPL